MQGMVKKWGNSAAVRIPASVLNAVDLRCDALVDIRAEDGRIVIERLAPAAPDLAALIAAITDENLHAEIDFGPAQGNEAW